MLFCFENNVNRSIRADLDALRPDLLSLAQCTPEVGLFQSRRDGHGALVYRLGREAAKRDKALAVGLRNT